ncbi:glycosyltransferase family 2 protein [Variibacter gotjawalensis]|uniref:glycosyltransferase family 2 protein n=1 Tax=Variibacter gotjawalensis TaxID=1333996 RepID=UPI00102BB7FC|nr:glycosyltransferase [Variibacter gotjawalensis]NIK47998.1 cellulose synthase/poly-beta-1,6-N-acetylglucosamine synthase-like glycosyltransferase [Variibacter gotjawalensis]
MPVAPLVKSRAEPDAAVSRPFTDSGAAPRCVEIDCVRRWFTSERLAEVEKRARRLGVGADEVLLASGEIAPDPYTYAQADAIGLDFVDLDKVPRALCPLDDEALFDAARKGLLPIYDGDVLRWAVAKPGLWMRAIIGRAKASAAIRQRFMLTTPQRLRRFVERHSVQCLHSLAAQRLRETAPEFSAAMPNRFVGPIVLVMLAVLSFLAAPQLVAHTLLFSLSALFIAGAVQRLSFLRHAGPTAPPLTNNLPLYTIIAALYRETDILPKLIAALEAIDYPREKLQIILALEPDDYPMRDAVAALKLGARYEVVLASMPPPRGKPKALNAALQYVRGDYVVVFDAEDKPEAGQLREVAAIFAADEEEMLACVQGRLTIENSDDGWLPSVFTAEYAGHFDVILPALAARDMPVPLGGSSTHARTKILRDVGAWDPYNVTEDADLGIRLARFGYRTAIASSSTYEEAPALPMAWIKQRTRWFKGWMQTWAVHARNPARLVRELGVRGALGLHFFLFGIVFAVLIQPVAWVLIGIGLLAPSLLRLDALPGWVVAFHFSALGLGYVASIIVKLEGLRRRELLTWRSGALLVARMPAYWALLSLAAWRALGQFFSRRFYWEKTDHGLARTSRRAQR